MTNNFKKSLIFWSVPVLFLFLWFFKQLIFSVLVGIIIGSTIQFFNLYLSSRLKINFYLSVFLTYLILASLLAFIIYSSLQVFSEEIPNFISKILPLIGSFKEFFPSNWQEILTGKTDYLSLGFKIFTNVFGGLISILSVIVITVYISLDKRFPGNLLELFLDEELLEEFLKIWRRIRLKIAFWFVGELFLMFFIGLSVYIFTGLVLKIKYSHLIALIAGILEFVPIIGPLITLIIASFIVFLEAPEHILITVVFFLLLQQFENNFLVPIVMKKAISVYPILVILGILIGGKIGGVFGIITVIPILGIFIELRHYLKMRGGAIGSTQDSGS